MAPLYKGAMKNPKQKNAENIPDILSINTLLSLSSVFATQIPTNSGINNTNTILAEIPNKIIPIITHQS